MTQDPKMLTDEIIKLRAEVTRLNAHRYLKVHNSFWRMILFQIVRGMFMGLGTVIGATVLVSILVSVLVNFASQIDFIPIIGEYAREIANEIAKATENPPK